jgi:hypothetical protein
MRPPSPVVWLFAAVLAVGCGEEGTPAAPPGPAPTAVPTPGPGEVVVGRRTGPTEITFVAAEPPPGSTISGCGPDPGGCSGRVRMRFRLLSSGGGPVLDAIGFLHATTKGACYRGSTGSFDLQPGAAREILIIFDQPDAAACSLPATISDMKVVLSAPIQTDGLQEWAIRYELRP